MTLNRYQAYGCCMPVTSTACLDVLLKSLSHSLHQLLQSLALHCQWSLVRGAIRRCEDRC
jgi:hypothetical protein